MANREVWLVGAGQWVDRSTWCPQMYPELQIARVEQATQAIPMERWCGGARGGRCAHSHHQVVPFLCLRESQAWGREMRVEFPEGRDSGPRS